MWPSAQWLKPGHVCNGLRATHPKGGTLQETRGFPPAVKPCFMSKISDGRWSRGFDQLHLAITLAVQDFHVTFVIAEDKHVPVTELCLLDRLFERHGPQRYGIKRTNHVRFRN